MKKVFEYVSQGRIISGNNYASCKVPFRKTSVRQKKSLINCPSVWNQSLSSMKRNISLYKFKHDVKKKHYLGELRIYYHNY